MKTYEKDQDESVMFEGQKARDLIELRKSIDKGVEEICQHLNQAFDLAEEEFKQLFKQYEPKLNTVLQGTELENVPIQQLALDYSKASRYGIIFGWKVEQDPIARLFQALSGMVKRQSPGAVPTSEDIVFDVKDMTQKWGTDQKVSENA